ncbi:unnamed protein product [Miscanthus lutarioriparius]|uniref:HAT C-terminal dimerisation domain-containing protein n=1 Tax=Miscanthus lutarioriparius TaxID=422564 RepID=A0A811RXV5_9POAL|nr:unnamed protein product [Miscanthus lutarioriparius]
MEKLVRWRVLGLVKARVPWGSLSVGPQAGCYIYGRRKYFLIIRLSQSHVPEVKGRKALRCVCVNRVRLITSVQKAQSCCLLSGRSTDYNPVFRHQGFNLSRKKKDDGYKAFVKNGWNGFHRKQRLKDHVGDVGGTHYLAMKKCDDLLQTRQHINVAFRGVNEIKVLEIVENDKKEWKIRDQGSNLLEYFQSFDSVFYLHLMLTILGITNTLSLALQRKDHDIVNGIKCVRATRRQLDELRREKWEKLLVDVYGFCEKNDISKLEMEDEYIDPKKRRHKSGITNKHYYQVDCFNDIIDWLLQELDSRFNETSSQLLVCSASLSPRDSFCNFNVDNLLSLAKLYPHDFDSGDLRDLNNQLGLYTFDVRDGDRFSNIQTVAELSQKMVKTRKHDRYPLVYRLLKLVLVLPVATATVERIFSSMKIVKTNLRNRIGDQFMSDCLICYVEKEEMMKITNESVIRRFMKMQERRFDHN